MSSDCQRVITVVASLLLLSLAGSRGLAGARVAPRFISSAAPPPSAIGGLVECDILIGD